MWVSGSRRLCWLQNHLKRCNKLLFKYAPLANFQTVTHTHTKWLQKKKYVSYKRVLDICTYHQAGGWIPHADKIVVPYCRRTVILYSICFLASFQSVCINGPFSLIVICQNNLLRPNVVLICISETFSTNSLPVAKFIVPDWGL